MNAAIKEQHDSLLDNMPEGASHDQATCPVCSPVPGGDQAHEGGGMSTFSEEDLKSAVAEAVAPLQAKIKELEGSQEAAALAAQVEEATTPLNEQIAELQAKLDASVLEAETAKTALTDTTTYLESVQAEEAAKVELASRREARIAQVKEVASFPDEHLEANADRWASMDEVQFEAQLADWRLISKPDTAKEAEKVPAETAMKGTAPSETGKDDPASNLREVMALSIRGFDPRTV